MTHFDYRYTRAPHSSVRGRLGDWLQFPGNHCQGLAEPVFKPLVVRNDLNSNNKED